MDCFVGGSEVEEEDWESGGGGELEGEGLWG